MNEYVKIMVTGIITQLHVCRSAGRKEVMEPRKKRSFCFVIVVDDFPFVLDSNAMIWLRLVSAFVYLLLHLKH